jgi:hypothetical protein
MHWSIFLIGVWFAWLRVAFGAAAYRERKWLAADFWAAIWICVCVAFVARIPDLRVAGWVGAIVMGGMPFFMRFHFWKPKLNVRPFGGIIDITWNGVILGIAAVLMIAQVAPVSMLDRVPPAPRPEFLRSALEECRFYLTSALQCILALGAVLGVCMTILWKPDSWKNQNPDEYDLHFRGAAGMVIAYAGSGLGILLWFLLPVYRVMEQLRTVFASQT